MYNFMLKQTSHLNQQEIIQINKWIKDGLEEWGKAWENGSTLRLFRKTPKERNEKIKESQNFQLKVGTTITISTDNAYALLIAKIHSIDFSTNSIIIISDKELSKNILKKENTPIYYHLDKHDGFTSFALALGNISGLLENTQKAKLLRSILISSTTTKKK
uniref:DUF4154 domain-containing protein n=1 Tax=Meloidogyne hapla TaxID=6305 RepID=A0A1I8BG20_MELHA